MSVVLRPWPAAARSAAADGKANARIDHGRNGTGRGLFGRLPAGLGAPVICSDIDANRYGLREHGIYFRKSDADDLAAKLQQAIDRPEWLAESGRRQSQHVRENFSWDRVVDEHLEIFQKP